MGVRSKTPRSPGARCRHRFKVACRSFPKPVHLMWDRLTRQVVGALRIANRGDA